jgi:hypothetical protein
MRFPARRSRHSRSFSSRVTGICEGSMPVSRSSALRASLGSTGRWPGVCASNRTNSCPSGKLPVSWCAACTASALLPTPAMPSMACTTTGRPVCAPSSTALNKFRSSSSRPVKAAMSRGRVCRTLTGDDSVPCAASERDVSTVNVASPTRTLISPVPVWAMAVPVISV